MSPYTQIDQDRAEIRAERAHSDIERLEIALDRARRVAAELDYEYEVIANARAAAQAASVNTCLTVHGASAADLAAHLRGAHGQDLVSEADAADRAFLRDLHRVVAANAGDEVLFAALRRA